MIVQMETPDRPYRNWSTEQIRVVMAQMETELQCRYGDTMRSIAEQVAKRHGMTYARMIQKDRRRPYAWARQEAAWEMRQRGHWSLPQIARTLGLTNHTTILHSVRAHEKRLMEATQRLAAE